MMQSLYRLAIAALVALAGTAVSATDRYPNRPVHLIVPYTAGGTADQLARIVGNSLSARWGQQVVVENRPGASGMIGSNLLAKAPPDGYTIGLAVFGTHATNVALYPDISYDAIRDFTPISLAVSSPLLLVAHPSLGAASVNDLIALAKRKPGELVYASGGAGSSPHIGMELFNSMAGTKMTHVPYKGTGGAYVDILSGRVSLIFDVLPTALPHVKSGKVLPIAVSSGTRLPQVPEVPTAAESGLPNFDFQGWFGFAGPAGLASDVLSELSEGIRTALLDPANKKKLTEAGLLVVASSPEDFAMHIKKEIDRMRELVRSANIKAN